jgi:hypothetical protein
MPAWLPTASITLVLGLTGLFVQFFFKWVPEPDEQKRRLKRVTKWAISILALVFVAANLGILLTFPIGPLPASRMLGVALDTCLLTVFPIIFLIQDNQGKHIDITRTQTRVMLLQLDALSVIASDPKLSDETTLALQAILRNIAKTGK